MMTAFLDRFRVWWTPQGDAQTESQVIRVGEEAGRSSARTAVPEKVNDKQSGNINVSANWPLLISEKKISRFDDLVTLPFHKCINEELQLAAHLGVSLAVLQVASNAAQVVLLIAEDCPKSSLEAVLELLEQKKRPLTQVGAQGWLCDSASLLLSVARGQDISDRLQAVRAIASDSGKSALWQSFTSAVAWGFENNAADVDFVVREREPLSQVAFKIDGKYVQPTLWKIPTRTMLQMLGIAWQRNSGGADPNFQPQIEQQCRLEIDLSRDVRVRLRWSSQAYDFGVVVTLRVQRQGASSKVLSLEQAGYTPWHIELLRRALHCSAGMVTFAGKVGSGKSVSLAILMSQLPPNNKYISFEDPVEIDIPGVYQKTIARDLLQSGSEMDVNFAAAVRALFRSSLDSFLLGEIRDQETGRVARAVLESGHGLFTTTHAASALGVFDKYMSPQIGIPAEVLATPGNVRLNVYQSLLPLNCPHCALDFQQLSRIHEEPSSLHRMADAIGKLYAIDTARLRFRNPEGCSHCRKEGLPEINGTAGRTVIAEMVEPDETMCELIAAADKVGLRRYWQSLSDGHYDSENFAGKSAQEVGIYKAALGLIDPQALQHAYGAFETTLHQRELNRAAANRRLHAVSGGRA